MCVCVHFFSSKFSFSLTLFVLIWPILIIFSNHYLSALCTFLTSIVFSSFIFLFFRLYEYQSIKGQGRTTAMWMAIGMKYWRTANPGENNNIQVRRRSVCVWCWNKKIYILLFLVGYHLAIAVWLCFTVCSCLIVSTFFQL